MSLADASSMAFGARTRGMDALSRHQIWSS
jgi:hypothetical protein